jgi:hypothetical protein
MKKYNNNSKKKSNSNNSKWFNSKFKFKKKGQGEIFGIALMFVVIVVGVIIFSQIKAISPDKDLEEVTKTKYRILAQSSLETILKTSSGCNIDGGSGEDTVKDLINVCLARSYGNNDVQAMCDIDDDGFEDTIEICAHSIKLLDDALYNVFNGSDALIANIPFFLEIELESNTQTVLTSENITNFGDYTYKGTVIDESNYRKYKFKKASSGLKPWATAQREIKVVLALYFR